MLYEVITHFDVLSIEGGALRLSVGAEGAALVGPLIPREAQPAQC